VGKFYEIMKDEPREWFLSLADDLLNTKILECQLFSWLLLEKAKFVDSLSLDEVHKLEGVLDNWVSIDTYGTVLYGRLWQLGTVQDLEVYSLQEFDNVWYRRLALVAAVTLNTKSRGGSGDVHRTLVVCERAVEDKEDMVVKALSWALRSLIRWDKEAVAQFLKKHDEKLAGRIKREVSHKLEHGTKN